MLLGRGGRVRLTIRATYVGLRIRAVLLRRGDRVGLRIRAMLLGKGGRVRLTIRATYVDGERGPCWTENKSSVVGEKGSC